MDWNFWHVILNTLQPGTLARIVIDLEDAQEDWEHHPGEAPPADVRIAINQLLGYITKLGQEWGDTAEFDFAEMIEEVREAEEEWLARRNRQDRDHWLGDYQ